MLEMPKIFSHYARRHGHTNFFFYLAPLPTRLTGGSKCIPYPKRLSEGRRGGWHTPFGRIRNSSSCSLCSSCCLETRDKPSGEQ